MKAKLWNEKKGEYAIWCPGCNFYHTLTTIEKNENGAQWNFNGNIDKPTFTPSLLVAKDSPSMRCHSYITDGKIKFLEDSFHSLKNTTVDLPEMED